MTIETGQNPWETETGLVNDVDGWIVRARFGKLDEYMQKIAAVATADASTGLMFLFDLIDESGEVIGNGGYSVGSGWVAADDGSSISHPKRNNVVGSCRYGELQNRVVKEIKVDMMSRGSPVEAKSWEGLGFHWMQEQKPTVGQEERSVLMPVLALGERKDGSPAPAPAAAPVAADEAPAADDPTTKKLVALVKIYDNAADFQKAALQIPEVGANDALMSSVLDDGAEGFYVKNKG